MNKKRVMFYVLLSLGILALIMFVLIYGPMMIFARNFIFFGFLQEKTDWIGVWIFFVLSAVLLTFLLTSNKKLKSKERNWKTKGIFLAFVISLFTEMFGAVLLVYLFSPFFKYPLLQRPLYSNGYSPLIFFIFSWVLFFGILLIIFGWKEVYDAKGLVKSGIYKYIRHPQYLGFILIILAWLLYWKTALILVLTPVFLYIYIKQAKREDAVLEKEYGKEFLEYKKKTPAFIPGLT